MHPKCQYYVQQKFEMSSETLINLSWMTSGGSLSIIWRLTITPWITCMHRDKSAFIMQQTKSKWAVGESYQIYNMWLIVQTMKEDKSFITNQCEWQLKRVVKSHDPSYCKKIVMVMRPVLLSRKNVWFAEWWWLWLARDNQNWLTCPYINSASKAWYMGRRKTFVHGTSGGIFVASIA